VQIAEVVPAQANPTPPPVEMKPPEPERAEVITASQSPVETAKVSEEPPPPEPVKPQEVAMIEQAAQVEIYTQKSAGAAQDGGMASALNAYVGQIHGALQKAKVARGITGAGQVMLGFTLDKSGKVLDREVIQSSGVPRLDQAALDWLDRADFPPLPTIINGGQRFNVPLTFRRKSG
jgi:periplasmic protein TonB